MSHLRMDPHREKRTKQRQDVARSSPKRGRSGKALASHFLTRVIIPLTPVKVSRMSMSCIRGLLLRSAKIIMPSVTQRRQSKALSMKTEKLQSMRPASNPVTLAFGLFSIRTGTVQSTSTKGSPWWKLSGSTGIGWQTKGTPCSTK
jgi:hypothetical protein